MGMNKEESLPSKSIYKNIHPRRVYIKDSSSSKKRYSNPGPLNISIST